VLCSGGGQGSGPNDQAADASAPAARCPHLALVHKPGALLARVLLHLLHRDQPRAPCGQRLDGCWGGRRRRRALPRQVVLFPPPHVALVAQGDGGRVLEAQAQLALRRVWFWGIGGCLSNRRWILQVSIRHRSSPRRQHSLPNNPPHPPNQPASQPTSPAPLTCASTWWCTLMR